MVAGGEVFKTSGPLGPKTKKTELLHMASLVPKVKSGLVTMQCSSSGTSGCVLSSSGFVAPPTKPKGPAKQEDDGEKESDPVEGQKLELRMATLEQKIGSLIAASAATRKLELPRFKVDAVKRRRRVRKMTTGGPCPECARTKDLHWRMVGKASHCNACAKRLARHALQLTNKGV